MSLNYCGAWGDRGFFLITLLNPDGEFPVDVHTMVCLPQKDVRLWRRLAFWLFV
jgi:hypothetical protein